MELSTPCPNPVYDHRNLMFDKKVILQKKKVASEQGLAIFFCTAVKKKKLPIFAALSYAWKLFSLFVSEDFSSEKILPTQCPAAPVAHLFASSFSFSATARPGCLHSSTSALSVTAVSATSRHPRPTLFCCVLSYMSLEPRASTWHL